MNDKFSMFTTTNTFIASISWDQQLVADIYLLLACKTFPGVLSCQHCYLSLFTQSDICISTAQGRTPRAQQIYNTAKHNKSTMQCNKTGVHQNSLEQKPIREYQYSAEPQEHSVEKYLKSPNIVQRSKITLHQSTE